MLSTLRRPWALAVSLVVVLPVFVLVGPTPAYAQGTVTVSVQGQGSVSGEGINCTQSGGPDCSEFYPNDPEECIGDPPNQTCFEPPPTRELTAGADGNGFTFSGFQGCDQVSGRTCTITVSSNRSVTATYVDAQNPAVTLTGPAAGPVRGTFAMSATASDNNGVKRVEFRINGTLVGQDTTAPYAMMVNSSAFSDGVKTLSARAVDLVDRTTDAFRNITIDNTAPALEVTGPDGSTFGPGSTQTWNITASDATSGMAGLTCDVAPAGTTPTLGPCSGPGSAHQESGLPGGSYVFTSRAVDAAGNETVATRSFTVDATAPQTSFTRTPKSVIRTTKRKVTVRFGLAASEPGTFMCGLDGKAWTTCSATPSFKVKRGKHTLRVVATDSVGNADATAAVYKWKVTKKV